ncbi:hypothetical protein [Clostridium botulinum]|uniref:Uncharacterized protein n=1 Tax=Clostridium botulinum (strain 657 / Type Ba4) TaxID=515621 RepID=A0A3F2ZSI0_CLOB6|nr:hypothetical protein [Clostridium botulinum]ACQ52343.1 hypothetical protein CLJ_B2228 [Clostridium botulinum Ba4 str. 657]
MAFKKRIRKLKCELDFIDSKSLEEWIKKLWGDKECFKEAVKELSRGLIL